MVLPEAINAKMFAKLALPIYMDSHGHKCHFKDVCLKLTKDAMMKKGMTDIEYMEEDENMKIEWEENYETLRSRPKMADQHTGKYWGSLFIAKLFKEVRDARNRKQKNKNLSITYINERIAYSKKLRQLEEDARQKEFIARE